MCLYREAMHLQCFPPTCYVKGGASRVHKRDVFYRILSIGCLLALCGSIMRSFWTLVLEKRKN